MACPWSLMDGVRVLLGETVNLSASNMQMLHNTMTRVVTLLLLLVDLWFWLLRFSEVFWLRNKVAASRACLLLMLDRWRGLANADRFT